MARRTPQSLDLELADLPPELRWREWMGRVEAVIFASSGPVGRDVLAKVVGRACNLDLILEDIRAELRGRPYELVAVAGGWQHRTKAALADAIRTANGFGTQEAKPLTESDGIVLIAIAYLQPITRSELGQVFGKAVGRDTIGHLRRLGFIAAGPRSPQPGAPYTYVTTTAFLSQFGLATLRDLPDIEALEDAGLLSKDMLLVDEMPIASTDHLDEGGDDLDDEAREVVAEEFRS